MLRKLRIIFGVLGTKSLAKCPWGPLLLEVGILPDAAMKLYKNRQDKWTFSAVLCQTFNFQEIIFFNLAESQVNL